MKHYIYLPFGTFLIFQQWALHTNQSKWQNCGRSITIHITHTYQLIDLIFLLNRYYVTCSKVISKIRAIEEENLADKPWQLKGEVSSHKRPENSLLNEYLQFERATRPAPEITEETTKSIHDIIRERIKDSSWDDPVRKVKPHEKADKYKRRIEVSQEKSKLGLAELYAQEYAKQKSGDQSEEDPEQKIVKKKLKSLFTRIDALLVYKE